MDLIRCLIIWSPLVLFAVPATSSLIRECKWNATFIQREKEIFNKTNYHKVCLGDNYVHEGELSRCNGHFINPRCVCAYDMYILEIWDLCDKSGAPNENGSLDHVDISFCKKYSASHNGPCQNGGELLPGYENLLAMDMKYSPGYCKCKEGYYGKFCDTTSRPIVCTETKTPATDLPDCKKEFIGYPYHSKCSLSLTSGSGQRHFECSVRRNVTDGMKDCNSAEYQQQSSLGQQGASSGSSALFIDTWFVAILLVLLLAILNGSC